MGGIPFLAGSPVSDVVPSIVRFEYFTSVNTDRIQFDVNKFSDIYMAQGPEGKEWKERLAEGERAPTERSYQRGEAYHLQKNGACGASNSEGGTTDKGRGGRRTTHEGWSYFRLTPPSLLSPVGGLLPSFPCGC